MVSHLLLRPGFETAHQADVLVLRERRHHHSALPPLVLLTAVLLADVVVLRTVAAEEHEAEHALETLQALEVVHEVEDIRA